MRLTGSSHTTTRQDDPIVGRPERVEHSTCGLGCLLWTDEREGPAREVVELDVDDEERASHARQYAAVIWIQVIR